MQNKTHIEMKPLQTGRQIFSWFRTDAINEPLNKYQMLERKVFRFIFGVLFIAMFLATNSSLIINYASVNGVDELFFEIFQLDLTLYIVSALIAMRKPKLAPLFQSLENICNACKQHTTILYTISIKFYKRTELIYG